ncbi:MAG TPA: GNAT family N-acetyltransferase [Dongiaceae bacterium]|nr:GNAT family N-acetyltransferase [Dongiaceae bacterium]
MTTDRHSLAPATPCDRANSCDSAIRPLRPSDRRRHDQLVAELDLLHHEALPGLIKPPAEARVPDDEFARRLGDPAVFLRGYESGRMLVGLIRAVLKESAEGRAHRAARVVLIEELIVDRQARGNRIGFALLQAARQWAQGLAATSIELNVYAFNIAAMDFYTAAGFAPRSMVLSRALT